MEITCQWYEFSNPKGSWNLKHDALAECGVQIGDRLWHFCRWHTEFFELNPTWPKAYKDVKYPDWTPPL